MPTTPTHHISGKSLADLIAAVQALPTEPVGTMCNMIKTSKPSAGGDGYSHTRQIAKDLYVQCYGECRTRGEVCTLGWVDIDNKERWSLGCNCFPP
jgi:hypothetical protein